MIASIKKNYINNSRILYEIIMSIVFSIHTGHNYNYILRRIIFIYFLIWTLTCILAPICVIWTDLHIIPMNELLEVIQYILAGIYYSFGLIVFVCNKKATISNYKMIQTDFVKLSKENGKDPNDAYEKVIHLVKEITIPSLVIIIAISFGPLLSTIFDLGKLPIDHRSHFILVWPKFIRGNRYITYAFGYVLQFIFALIEYTSIIISNLVFITIVYELNVQNEILLNELENAFINRKKKEFEILFKYCIYHHQVIIKFLNDFKSYFKWILFIDIICIQIILAISVYLFIKVDSSFGYKVKLVAILFLNMCPIFIHCNIGEGFKNMHGNLANHIYNMTWYDMPNQNKQLIIIMLQRTQKDMSISSGILSNKIASKALIGQVLNQTYTILNLLLRT